MRPSSLAFLLNLLPHVIAKRIERYRACRRIGVDIIQAIRISFGVRAWSAFLAARLDLLPDGFAKVVGTVVDVGANRGDWSDVVLHNLRPSRLIAIEPNPAVFAVLSNRFESSSLATCLNLGASSLSSSLPFHITVVSECASFLTPDPKINNIYGGSFSEVETITVKVSPLDVILRDHDHISLLKIDVQGYERDVLAGAEETLKKTEYVLIEANFMRHYESDIQFPELDQAMSTHGFVLANLSKPFIKQGQVLWADALYRKR